MIFSSLEFLFLFLSITLLGYFAIPRILRNIWHLVASILFYDRALCGV